MHLNPGFELRTICGEKVVVAAGLENINFNKLINFNDTAAYLWQSLGTEDFTTQTMADLLLADYDVDPATALADAEKLLADWQKLGLVSE